MFGKPAWFSESHTPWKIAPVSWRGWAYFVGWGAVVALPFLAMAAIDKGPESLIWLAVASYFFVRDARRVHQELAAARDGTVDEVFVIDERTDVSRMATRNFDFQLRAPR